MDELGVRELAPVIRLRPIRTLVVARDLAFRNRALTVLGELGVAAFAVAPLEPTEQLVAMIRRERADVAVLDVTGCASAAASVVYALSTAAPRVGVVLVASRGHVAARLPTLDKWGWAEDLSGAVQEAYRRGNPLREEAALCQPSPLHQLT